MERRELKVYASKIFFDMIASDEKKETYIRMSYHWAKRLFVCDDYTAGKLCQYANAQIIPPYSWSKMLANLPCRFTHAVISSYGIEDGRLQIEKEIESITIGKPKKGWCVDELLNKDVFIVKLK